MPLRAVITEGARADCKEACAVIDGFAAEALLADRAFDTDAVVEEAIQRGMKVVIPPKKSRKKKREYDRYLYKARHLVENAFLHLKRWRGIATRMQKQAILFLLPSKSDACRYGLQ